ncbi:hypothetical protein DSY14_16365 [Nocardiopsis sp. MG754419]|nr:hypothetical protein [Nocardiopsis sp. MG754419]
MITLRVPTGVFPAPTLMPMLVGGDAAPVVDLPVTADVTALDGDHDHGPVEETLSPGGGPVVLMTGTAVSPVPRRTRTCAWVLGPRAADALLAPCPGR